MWGDGVQSASGGLGAGSQAALGTERSRGSQLPPSGTVTVASVQFVLSPAGLLSIDFPLDTLDIPSGSLLITHPPFSSKT